MAAKFVMYKGSKVAANTTLYELINSTDPEDKKKAEKHYKNLQKEFRKLMGEDWKQYKRGEDPRFLNFDPTFRQP